MVDRKKLKHDIAIHYAQVRSSEYLSDKDITTEDICANMINDFAIAYRVMDNYTDEFMDCLLHENGQ